MSRRGVLQEVVVAVGGEVLLAAGPYHSPKLLQLSGIGPAAALERVGIPQAADLPVGQSAQVRASRFLACFQGLLLYSTFGCKTEMNMLPIYGRGDSTAGECAGARI